MRFEWDPAKDAANRARHGLGLDEATEVFTSGTDYVEIFDSLHSTDEDRWVAIGPIPRGVITVVFTERDEDCLRIISARPATRREIQTYLQHVQRGEP